MLQAMSYRHHEASILDKVGPPESLQDLRDALDIIPKTWTFAGVRLIRTNIATNLLFASDVAMLAVDIRALDRHCDLIVTLRTNSKTAMCAVVVQNIAQRFAQVKELVQALVSEESEIYRLFLDMYARERRFVYSDIGRIDVGFEAAPAQESLEALRVALANLPYAAHTEFMFKYEPATLTVEIRAPNDLIVSLRTNSKTAMCEVQLTDIQERFAQVEKLVRLMDEQRNASTATVIYTDFVDEYSYETRFVTSDIGMRHVGA